MIQFLVPVLLFLFSRVVALPADVADIGFSASTNLSDGVRSTTPPLNGTASFNATVDDDRFTENWQYNNNEECDWAIKYIPYVSSECSEYCEADTYNWGYRYHRLRYHIKLTGNGQNPDTWCDNFKARMMYNCGVKQPDFFTCNREPSREAGVLRVWAFDGSKGKIVQKSGVNLRFDFHPWWEPRDAMHDCVRSAIREATCAGTIFTNGLRCIPTLHLDQNGHEFDESSVGPNARCLYNDEVPAEAR